MKDYYSILEVSESSNQGDIKKSYRRLSKKYHPDLNQGNKKSEEMFKEVAEAYEILGSVDSRKTYDSARRPKQHNSSFDFDNWVKDNVNRKSGSRDRDFGRGRGGFRDVGSKPKDSSYLNIESSHNLSIFEMMSGTSINLQYKRWTVSNEFNKELLDKSIIVHINLKDKNIPIHLEDGCYYASIKITSLGNEDFHKRPNLWGDMEGVLIQGDYLIKIKIDTPKHIDIENKDIIHWVDIPLYKTMFKGEKIRVSTIFKKEYEAEINTPAKLNNLKFTIKGGGIKGKEGSTLGNYIIKFNIIPPDLSKVNKSDLDILKQYLIDGEG